MNWFQQVQMLLEFRRLLRQGERIMAAIDDLRAKVAELQAAVDADQASDAAAVAALQEEIDRLKSEMSGGVPASEVPGLIESLEGIKADVSGPNA